MATLRTRPSFENWDDDFEIDDDFAARQLSYSSSATSSTFSNRNPSSRSGLSGTSSNKINLEQFAEHDEDDFDYGIATINATAKASRLRKQASMQLVFNAQKHGIELPEHIKQANTLKQDPNTLRNKISTMHTIPADNSLISGSLYEPPAASETTKPSYVEEDLEDGFDFESSAPLKLTLQNLKKASASESDFDDESLGFRAASRLSQLSSLSTVTTATTNSNTTYNESETDIEDLDAGFEEFPPNNLDFRQRLEKTRQKAAEDARKETELWRLKQEASQLSGRMNANGPVDTAADLLDGLELDDVDINNLTSKGTVHRNAMINGKRISNMKNKKSSIDLGRSTVRNTASGMHSNSRNQSKSSAQFMGETLRTPQKIPSRRESSTRLKSLRAVQSMANLGSTRKTSAIRQGSNSKPSTLYPTQTISSRHLRRKVFGDGSELDLLHDLSEVPSTEHTLRGVPSQLLEQYKEKPVKSTLRHHTKASQLKDRSNQLRNRHGASPQKSKYSTMNKPALIQQLGAPIQTPATSDMRFNAQKQIWEGNDMELKKFDSMNKTPGLIAYISHNGIQQTSGDMMFDAQNLRWISSKIDAEEETDPFAGLDDLEDDGLSQTFSRCHSDMQLKGSLSASNINQIAVGNEFELTKEFVSKLQHEDERWIRKYQGWFPAGETYNRDYLGEIRDMIVNQ